MSRPKHVAFKHSCFRLFNVVLKEIFGRKTPVLEHPLKFADLAPRELFMFQKLINKSYKESYFESPGDSGRNNMASIVKKKKWKMISSSVFRYGRGT